MARILIAILVHCGLNIRVNTHKVFTNPAEVAVRFCEKQFGYIKEYCRFRL